MPHAKIAKCAKESKSDRKGVRKEFILGDLGVLERALASGREKRTRNAELGTRNEESILAQRAQSAPRGRKEGIEEQFLAILAYLSEQKRVDAL